MKKLLAKADEQKAYLLKKMGEDRSIMIGDPAIDWVMGGYKRGCSNLFYGPSKSGKTTVAMILAGIEQKKTNGGLVLIFDSEYANDMNKDPEVVERWKAAGLDPDLVLAVSSNEVNELFTGLGDLEADLKTTRQGMIDGVEVKKIPNYINIAAIIVDSWGGIQSEQAKEKMNAGNLSGAANSYGGNAKTINPIIQTILRISATYGITSLHIQHCIENMDKDPRTGAYKGPKWILLGGQKLRYLSQSITFIETVEAGDSLFNADGLPVKDAGGVAVGKRVRIRCEKSRKQVEGRKAESFINFRDCTFANKSVTLFNLAFGLGVIPHAKFPEKDAKGKPKLGPDGEPIMKENNQWYLIGDQKIKGKDATIAAMATDQKLFDFVWKSTLESNSSDAVGVKMGAEEGVGSDAPDEDAKALEELSQQTAEA